MYRLFEKIKKCRQALVTWSNTTFGNFKTQIQEKQMALKELALQNDSENQPLIGTLKNDINTLLHQDEIFWRQRSRSIWLPASDKNTNFSIKEPTSGVEKITFLGSHLKVGNGALMRTKLLKQPSIISRTYLHHRTQQIWRGF